MPLERNDSEWKNLGKIFSEISEFSTSPFFIHNLYFNTMSRKRPRKNSKGTRNSLEPSDQKQEMF